MDIRYYVEHVVLPSLIEESPKEFINTLGHGKEELIFEIYNQASEKINQPNPYVKEDFHVDLVKFKDEWYFQIIKMPEKDIKAPFCHFVVISLDKNQENPRYFTLENQETAILLCEWKGSRHFAYGKFKEDEDVLQRIVDIRSANTNQ